MTQTDSLWSIPYGRNLLFTGREEVLSRLHDSLRTDAITALTHPQGISGLGGIGKTQTAIEYAYRYQHDYQALFWVRADSPALLVSDFVTIAQLVHLPEKDEQDQAVVIAAVMRWLQEHTYWLLILDNLEDPALLHDFIPSASRGHVLLTTRAVALGTLAQRIEVEAMTAEVGALFLLRRAAIVAPDAILEQAAAAERADALAISQLVGGLPLALDQAGAYIEETGCGLAGYLDLYHTRSAALLKARGTPTSDYPASVATTWSLSFEKVRRANPAAAELLRFCAFLYPEAIPEELIVEGGPALGPVLQSAAADALKLNAAIKELRKFSLLQREPASKTLAVHRLVQAVLRHAMNKRAQRRWAERTVRAVNRTFPDPEFPMWTRCQRCLPHALECATHIEQWIMESIEAARLLSQTGCYLQKRAQYEQVEPLYRSALKIYERLESKPLEAAIPLSNLAVLYESQGKYEQAEPLYRQTLAIYEQHLGPEDPEVAISLNNLAALYHAQGKYEQAEPLFQQALAIKERTLGSEHLSTAMSLNNLAALYESQGKYAQAEPLYQRSLAICEQVLEPEHPDIATSLNNLAWLYYTQGKYEQAEPLYQRSLAICEQVLGTEHPDTAGSLNNLAVLYYAQGKYERAEPLFQRVLAIREQVLGPAHPDTAISLNNLAALYQEQGRYEEAVPLYERALAIREQILEPTNPHIATSLNNLAVLYHAQGKYEQAEPLYLRALSIREQVLGPLHSNVAVSLNNLAALYHAQGKYEQAEPLYQRALAIREQVLGPLHPDTATSLNNLAGLYEKQGKYEQAELLYLRIPGQPHRRSMFSL